MLMLAQIVLNFKPWFIHAPENHKLTHKLVVFGAGLRVAGKSSTY